MHSDKEFIISLIGRTNVGKSTLFNRISGSRDALTFDRPGVTRDLKEKEVQIWNKRAILIDSPGMFDYAQCDNDPKLIGAINRKLKSIIDSSDIVVFVVDGASGLTPNDREIAKILRKANKKVIVAVNKSERRVSETVYIDAMSLGFNDITRISAEHGLGLDDLFQIISEHIPCQNESLNGIEDQMNPNKIRLAIVGRPNVGKSTLVNKIIGKDKQLVADFAGVTRESSSSDFEFDGRSIRIIDTPGIRRRSRITDPLEKISVSNSMNSYKRADAVILVIDASTLISGEIEKQDLTLASNIIKEGKALVIAFNKYDATPYGKNDSPEFLKRNFRISLSQLKNVPFLFISALNEVNIDKMLRLVIQTYDKQSRRFKTSDLNDWLAYINKTDFLQSGAIRFKLKYIMQVKKMPPTFLIFVSNKTSMRKDHERFIVNNLKKALGLDTITINVIFRSSETKRCLKKDSE